MLSIDLMLESARRQTAPSRPLLEDAAIQAAYCLDAPNDVHDGAEWFDDHEMDCRGPVPRIVPVRETPNAELSGARSVECGSSDANARPLE